MDPPIQTEYFLSGGAIILIFIVLKRTLCIEERPNCLPWGKSSDFLLHTVSNSWVHGGSSGENSVGVEVLTDIDIALHNGIVSSLVDSSRLHTQEGRLKMENLVII